MEDRRDRRLDTWIETGRQFVDGVVAGQAVLEILAAFDEGGRIQNHQVELDIATKLNEISMVLQKCQNNENFGRPK